MLSFKVITITVDGHGLRFLKVLKKAAIRACVEHISAM